MRVDDGNVRAYRFPSRGARRMAAMRGRLSREAQESMSDRMEGLTRFVTRDGVSEHELMRSLTIRPVFKTWRNETYVRTNDLRPLATLHEPWEGQEELERIVVAMSDRVGAPVRVLLRPYVRVQLLTHWPWQPLPHAAGAGGPYELVVKVGDQIAFEASTIREALLGVVTLAPLPHLLVSHEPMRAWIGPAGHPSTRVHELAVVDADAEAREALECRTPSNKRSALRSLLAVDWVATLVEADEVIPREIGRYWRDLTGDDALRVNAFIQHHQINATRARLEALTQ